METEEEANYSQNWLSIQRISVKKGSVFGCVMSPEAGLLDILEIDWVPYLSPLLLVPEPGPQVFGAMSSAFSIGRDIRRDTTGSVML